MIQISEFISALPHIADQIATVLAFITILAGAIKSYRNGIAIQQNTERLDLLRIEIDGRLKQLLTLAGAQGEVTGRANERADVAQELRVANTVRADVAAKLKADAPPPETTIPLQATGSLNIKSDAPPPAVPEPTTPEPV